MYPNNYFSQPQIGNMTPQNPYMQTYKSYANNPWQQTQMPNMGQINAPQQPTFQTPHLSGRYISQPNEITANEVPMDGTVGFFPTQDQQFIYAKAWNADGKIETGIYKLVTDLQEPENQNVNILESIQQRLDNIEALLSQPQKTTSSSRKKGDAENE